MIAVALHGGIEFDRLPRSIGERTVQRLIDLTSRPIVVGQDVVAQIVDDHAFSVLVVGVCDDIVGIRLSDDDRREAVPEMVRRLRILERRADVVRQQALAYLVGRTLVWLTTHYPT